jgi:hypothetical protein
MGAGREKSSCYELSGSSLRSYLGSYSSLVIEKALRTSEQRKWPN